MHKLPLEQGEKIIEIYRKHWLVYFFDACVLVLLLALPHLAHSWLTRLGISTPQLNSDLATVLYLLWFTLLWAYFFIMWTNNYLDAWIVTDKRIIDIEQKSLFHRDMSDFRIEKIQNVTVRERGLFANLMGYGTMQVETAGERVELIFDYLPNPYHVRDIISECHDKCLARLENSGLSQEAYEMITER